MSRSSVLVTLLRVRRVQEDVARAAVAAAHADAVRAREALAVRERAIDARRLPEGANGTAYVAAMAAARSLALNASAARAVSAARDQTVRRAVAHWAEMTARADGVAEGVAQERAAADAEVERLEQAERDDASTAAWRRAREPQL